MQILREFGYLFEPRGYVKVKGKGDLMTYFLVGSRDQDSKMADTKTALPNTADDEGVEV